LAVDCSAPLPDIPCPTLSDRADYAMDMQPLPDMLTASLEVLPPGPLHARAGFWLHQMGQTPPLSDWIAKASGVGLAVLLCLAARIQEDASLLIEAERLAESEWLSPEIAWSGIGTARLALGDVPGALVALTHPDAPPTPLTLPALSWLLQHLLLSDGDPQPVLDHLGAGHDAAEALLAVATRVPDLARAALSLLPSEQRDEAALRLLLTGAIPDRLPPVGPTVTVIHAARQGQVDLARARLAPLLIERLPTWRASAPAQAAPVYHHLALACAALSDIEGALWSLERLAGQRPRLRGACQVSVFCPDDRLVSWALAQATDDETRIESLRQAGRITARLGQHQRARSLLRSAAALTSQLTAFYPRRLARQVVSSAQIEIGAPLDALTTIDAIDRRRFGDEQRTAAATALLFAGNSKAATQVLRSFPMGHRRAESCCAVSAAMFPGSLGPGV
jgi:hypothetical protein